MKLIDFYRQIKDLNQCIIYTHDVAALLGISLSHTSKLLKRLADSGQLVHLSTGVWGFPEKLDPLNVPNYLTAPFPCYLSLFTSLYYHDMIMQIPSMIYLISPARKKIIHTPIAVFSIHHVTPDFFCGFKQDEKSGIRMATPEKTIVDFAYFQTSRTSQFKSLPELELPAKFDRNLVKGYIAAIHSKSKQSAVTKIVDHILEGAQ